MNDPDLIPDEDLTDEERLAREQKLAAIREYQEGPNWQWSTPGSLTGPYLKERRKLRRIYPGTLEDLAREGIIKLRVFDENDASRMITPDPAEADS